MVFLRWSKAVSGFVLIACALLVLGKACQKEAPQMQAVLNEGEREKFIFNARTKTLTTVTRKSVPSGAKGKADAPGNIFVSNTRGLRKFALTIGEDGHAKVATQTKGWAFEPGVQLSFADGQWRFGPDAQVVYWNSAGLNVGLTADKHWDVRGVISGSYLMYSNTSIVVGLDTESEIYVGVRIAL